MSIRIAANYNIGSSADLLGSGRGCVLHTVVFAVDVSSPRGASLYGMFWLLRQTGWGLLGLRRRQRVCRSVHLSSLPCQIAYEQRGGGAREWTVQRSCGSAHHTPTEALLQGGHLKGSDILLTVSISLNFLQVIFLAADWLRVLESIDSGQKSFPGLCVKPIQVI